MTQLTLHWSGIKPTKLSYNSVLNFPVLLLQGFVGSRLTNEIALDFDLDVCIIGSLDVEQTGAVQDSYGEGCDVLGCYIIGLSISSP